MRFLGSITCLFLLSTSLSAQIGDPGRIERLRASLQPGELVPGVNRGWEGDPRQGSWVTLCDEQSNAKACWLVGIQLTPAVNPSRGNARLYDRPRIAPRIKSGADPLPKSAAEVVGVHYLNKGCGLGAGEACADLGDYYRFRGQDEINPYVSFDLKQAYGLYQKACELASAYGCYVFAEFTDRGIATPRNTGLARSQFQELCQSGLAIACLRQRAPATAYPYKVFSKADSTCSSDEECWSECKGGKWGACQRIPGGALATKPANEVASLRQRACTEGSGWGCGVYDVAPCYGPKCKKPSGDTKKALMNGCKAGSEYACLRACRTFPEVEQELSCATRERTMGGYTEFADKSLEQRMQECFGGTEQGCFDFFTNTKVIMTPEEAQAYKGGSAFIFRRMQCNSGYMCKELAQYYGSQLGWAYQISDHVSSYANDPFFRSLTPIEQALAGNWLMMGSASDFSLPPDAVAGLDESCLQGVARSCRALAYYFAGKSVKVLADPTRQAETDRVLKALKKLDESANERHRGCDVVVGSTVAGSVTVLVTPESKQCHERTSKSQAETRASLMQTLDFLQSTPSSNYVTDPALRELAEDYRAKARKAGDIYEW